MALMCSDVPTWKRLINHTLTVDEQIALITEIFSDHSQIMMIRNIHRDDAQRFVDVIDQVSLRNLSPPDIAKFTVMPRRL